MKKFLKYVFVICITLLGAAVYMGYSKYNAALEDIPLEKKIYEIRNAEDYTEISEIPDMFVNAMVAVEDKRFYKHKGFDIIGTCRAVASDIKNMELLEGGSTITQQLAKNLYFPADHSPTRKIAEIFMAKKIEKEYSKEEILELYFNVIYYGKGCYSIGSAAEKYFDKSPGDMTPYECTLLAGIPNAPSVYSENKELARQRQKKVLKSMVEAEYISKEEMEEILE